MNKAAFKIGRSALYLAFIAALVSAVRPAFAESGRVGKDSDGAKAADRPPVKPGQTIRVDDRRVGAEGHYLIRVPKDYSPDRAWPTIFCYHGLGGSPTCWPFDQLTGNKGFIIVGMPYWQKGLEGYRQKDRDVTNLKLIFKEVCSRVNVDRKMVFVGGYSKGGWYASVLLAKAPRTWAGAIILGAGRDKQTPGPGGKIRGMPIFIGVGEKEKNNPHGKSARDHYRLRGAKVTFEEWKGLGHQMNMNSQLLRDWLAKNGPLRTVQKDFAAARKAEQARKLGRAYRIYRHLAGLSQTDQTCKKADTLAKAIANRANEGLAAAEKHLSEKEYAQAAKALARLARVYAGSRFAARAEEKLKTLREDPQTRRIIEQAEVDVAADALETTARNAEKDKNYAEALRLYGQYVKTYPKAGRFEQVRKHLETLKADAGLAARIKQRAADKEAAGWLRMADNYINAGLNDKAKGYLKKIIDRYGDTTWGPKAKQRLKKIGG